MENINQSNDLEIRNLSKELEEAKTIGEINREGLTTENTGPQKLHLGGGIYGNQGYDEPDDNLDRRCTSQDHPHGEEKFLTELKSRWKYRQEVITYDR